jgi:hypothetical protein
MERCWSDNLLASFKGLLTADGKDVSVEELSLKEFDPKGKYQDAVVEKIKSEVDGGSVKVFRVETGKARVEYWVVGIKDERVLGLRAKAVES